MNVVDEFNHDNVLTRDYLKGYVEYVDELKGDAADEDQSEEDRASFQELLDDIDDVVVEQIRDMLNDTEDDSFISEDFWQQYADNEADEIYGLSQSGLSNYFKFDEYASDLQTDYTGYRIDGTLYYARY